MIRSKQKRSGFTLVELMISAAITVIIMTILSICFQTSMSAMSAMRAQGDAADQLRAVGEVMKRDIKADHFLPAESAAAVANNGRRLSDYDFRGAAQATSGFFFIRSPASFNEGNDGIFDSYRSDLPGGPALWFTSVLAGGTEGNLYTASVGGNIVSSEAAEVAYFLIPTGQGTSGPAGLPTFHLIRRQRLIASNSASGANLQLAVNSGLDPNVREVISTYPVIGPPAQTIVNTMGTIANGANRPAFPGLLSSPRTGDDIIISNVISFEVKPTWQPRGGLPFIPGPRVFGNSFPGVDVAFTPAANTASSDAPYDTLSAFPGNIFDTITPLPIRINAVQIRLRIYDPKVKTARQSSMVIEL